MQSAWARSEAGHVLEHHRQRPFKQHRYRSDDLPDAVPVEMEEVRVHESLEGVGEDGQGGPEWGAPGRMSKCHPTSLNASPWRPADCTASAMCSDTKTGLEE